MNESFNSEDVTRPASVLNLMAGLWLVLSPWALRFVAVPAATCNAVVVGVAIAIIAGCRLARWGTRPLSWTNVVLGGWLLLAPFALQFVASSAATWDHIILGGLTILFGLWAGVGSTATRRTSFPPNQTYPQ